MSTKPKANRNPKFGSARRFTDDHLIAWLRSNGGLSTSAIAREFGMSRWGMMYRLKCLNLERRVISTDQGAGHPILWWNENDGMAGIIPERLVEVS